MPDAEKDVPLQPEDWCDHHPEWADRRGHCRHPECHVAGPQVRPVREESA